MSVAGELERPPMRVPTHVSLHVVKRLVTPPVQSRRDSRAPCSNSRAGGTCMRTGRLQAGVTLVLAVAAGARAATITVNSTADAAVNDGNCTLREAILAANSDTAVDGCAAGNGPDVVIVPAGTYGLGGKLDVTD